MKPITFEEATHVLGAGNNPNTGNLPIVFAVDPETPGYALVMSCWEPDEEELRAIIADKKIYIGVMCSPDNKTQPPILATGINPFKEHRFTPLVNGKAVFLGSPLVDDLIFEDDGEKYSVSVITNPFSFSVVGVDRMDSGEVPESQERNQYISMLVLLRMEAKYQRV